MRPHHPDYHTIFKHLDTDGYQPLGDGQFLFFIRYKKGNLVTARINEIQKLKPKKNKTRQGKIYFKNGAKDKYYRAWPITISIPKNNR